MSKSNEIILKYSAMLDEAYKNRTAGDYTWPGLLTMFAKDLESAKEADRKREFDTWLAIR